MKLSELVARYIDLRDTKARYKAEYEAKVAGLQDTMDKIEAKLLEVFSTTGMESVKTEAGTAYASVRTFASVADKEAFLEFVRAKEEWSLLDVRASKLAVEQFVDANEDIPPGISLRQEKVVNVRRSA
jgi:hypothetical protein